MVSLDRSRIWMSGKYSTKFLSVHYGPNSQMTPLTGQDWRIDSKISNYIDFKCDKSRLVSEFSQNCADNDI